MSNPETQPGASSFDGADAWNAYQRSSGMQTPEEMAAGRYEVVRGAFWWRVKVGDGEQTVGRCYTQAEAERLAAALRTAFLDGAFVIVRQVAEERRLRDAIKGLGQLVREQSPVAHYTGAACLMGPNTTHHPPAGSDA